MIILDQNLMDSDMLNNRDNRDTEPNSQGINQHQTKSNAPQTQNIFVYFYSGGAIWLIS